MTLQTLDVVVPIYNEEEALPELIARLKTTLNNIAEIEWKIIFVENGSTDNSHRMIELATRSDSRVTELRLIRNFGMEGGVYAGLSVSRADACVIMQGDLEDPPELIEDFVKEWRRGFHLVYGEVKTRQSLPISRRFFTAIFYALAKYLTDGLIRSNASDFRLITRQIREFLMTYTNNGSFTRSDQNSFLRSLVTWPSDRIIAVPFERGTRTYGRSKFRTISAITWSLAAVITLSLKPLRIISALGILMFLGSLSALATLTIRALIWGVPFPGFGTIVGLQVLFFGMLMLALGVVSEYIARILLDVRARPKFIFEHEEYEDKRTN